MGTIAGKVTGMVAGKARDAAVSLKILTESGIVRLYSPRVLAGMATTLYQWGPHPAGGFKTLAQRMPDQVAVIDEIGSLTFGELHRRTNALAAGLRERGVGEGDGVAVMCRNHRGFIEASIAISKLGADVLYLNTAFAGPQLADVLARVGVELAGGGILQFEGHDPLPGLVRRCVGVLEIGTTDERREDGAVRGRRRSLRWQRRTNDARGRSHRRRHR